MVPKTLAENAGLNAMEIISSLYAEHASGNTKVGLDLEEGRCKDVSTLNIWDLHITKFFALKYAADAACTVLRVDQVTSNYVFVNGFPNFEVPKFGLRDEDDEVPYVSQNVNLELTLGRPHWD
ncbi:T-complex protein 1 subunit theta-like [Prunus avium]|uniref:T-complex protein 1 subunit theta-like n=1 Tax=Prunus avium TaxID=42229 RepID=A0A6P5S8T1_PRUAV|nr:T-complex protein 1 subunit theta-like [Prunus avium]